MSGSAVLEVAIGLVFVYVLLSLLSSAIQEVIAQFLALRGRVLTVGVRRLITDPSVLKSFYEHPVIKSLAKDRGAKPSRPSYIPSRAFAVALLDTVAPVAGKLRELSASSDDKTDAELADVKAFKAMRAQLATHVSLELAVTAGLDEARFPLDLLHSAHGHLPRTRRRSRPSGFNQELSRGPVPAPMLRQSAGKCTLLPSVDAAPRILVEHTDPGECPRGP